MNYTKDTLNPNQEKFIDNYIETGNKVGAYMEAYNNDNYNGCASSAVKLLKIPKVNEAYQKKLEELHRIKVLSIEERKQFLANEIMNEKNKTADKVKALDVLNKMEAIYVEKIEADNNVTVEIGGNLKTWAE